MKKEIPSEKDCIRCEETSVFAGDFCTKCTKNPNRIDMQGPKIKVIRQSFERDGLSYPTLKIIEADESFGFTFGIKRARLIVAVMSEIQKFVEDHKEFNPK